ncbi:hypothetical protein [uncultured Duncaniella sp.]|uniref:hypothetical protein n=2 Tax=uncultured Duncaniella sp. TaxID=2768039 RepID=UPI00260AEC89|nr:hypothetical protein [uncultured Duncaniella sp.]
MKKLILTISIILAVCSSSIGKEPVNVKIPDGSFDFILPDTASFVAFLVDKKTNARDNKLRVKVASLEDGRGLWSAPYYKGRLVDVCNYGVLIQDAFSVKLFDAYTGRERMELKSFPVFIDNVNDRLISVSGAHNTKLKCHSLATGELIWESKIEPNKGIRWQELKRTDSDTLLFQSDYIGKINLKDGTLKSYPLNSARFDKKQFWSSQDIGGSLSFMFGMLGGLVEGIVASTHATSSLWMDSDGSKATISDGKIYVSDRDKVACLDLDLNEIWQSPLPKGTSGFANLQLHGDTIKLLNTGGILLGKEWNKTADSFIGTFEKASGQCIKIDYFPKNWDEKQFGKALMFVCDPTFSYGTDERFSPLSSTLDKAYLMDRSGKVLLVDTDFNIHSELMWSDLYPLITSVRDHNLLFSNENEPRFFRTDSNGKTIEKYPEKTTDLRVKGQRLVHVFDRTLTVTGLPE